MLFCGTSALRLKTQKGIDMNSRIEKVLPADIERRSFEIITQELSQMGKVLQPGTEPIVKRCIHTSADFDYADNLYFSENAIEAGLNAIKSGATIASQRRVYAS